MDLPHWTLKEDEAVDPAPVGADGAHFHELCVRALRAVRELPRPVRRVFRMRWRRAGYPEIARRMAISEATARKYYSDARRMLTAAILCASALLLAMAGPSPLSLLSPVHPSEVRPSRVTVSDARIAELSIEEAEVLLGRVLAEQSNPTQEFR